MTIVLFVIALALLVGLPLIAPLQAWKTRLDARPLMIRDRYRHELHRAVELVRDQQGGRRAWGIASTSLAGGTRIQPGEEYEGPIVVEGDLVVSTGGVAQAALVNGALDLDADASIRGWADATGPITATEGSKLSGSVRTEQTLFVAPTACFERLEGAPVYFGRRDDFVLDVPSPAGSAATDHVVLDPGTPRLSVARVVAGDLHVRAGTILATPAVVLGDLTLGDGAVAAASVKVHGKIQLGRGCRVDGSLIAHGPIEVAGACWLRGAVISEERISLASGCTVGQAGSATTVSAPVILAGSGARVHGVVHALTQGLVEDPPGSHSERMAWAG